MKELLNKLKDKVCSEWNDYYNSLLLLPKEDIICESYKTSHYGEVADFFTCLDSDDWCPFDEDFIARMLEYKGSIIKKIYDTWMDFCNPEKFNFFTPEGLSDIIWLTFHKNEGGF
jgi:hypothetical protein